MSKKGIDRINLWRLGIVFSLRLSDVFVSDKSNSVRTYDGKEIILLSYSGSYKMNKLFIEAILTSQNNDHFLIINYWLNNEKFHHEFLFNSYVSDNEGKPTMIPKQWVYNQKNLSHYELSDILYNTLFSELKLD